VAAYNIFVMPIVQQSEPVTVSMQPSGEGLREQAAEDICSKEVATALVSHV